MEILAFSDLPAGYSVKWEVCTDDSGMGPPWEGNDGHGIIQHRRVDTWKRYPEKAPGEILLYRDRDDAWFYNVRETLPIALRDAWGLSPEALADLARRIGRTPTKREIAAESVRQDAEYCREWLTGRYSWVGVCVKLCGPDGETISRDSLWGIEWDDYGGNDYPEECAREIARGLIESAGLDIDSRGAAWRAALREARESRYWLARGVQTVGA